MTQPLVPTDVRAADLGSLVDVLRSQADVKYDAVVPASRLRYQDGRLHIAGGAVRWSDDGATEVDAVLAPSAIFDAGVADKLGIPLAYLRRLRDSGQRVVMPDLEEAPGPHEPFVPVERHLIDLNVNGWLQANPERTFLIRGFRTDDPDAVGYARAFLSDRLDLRMDNLDVLLAALDGARQAGIDTSGLTIDGDLTERSMRVRITAPGITALAPVLLANYQSPWGRGIERVREVAEREGMAYPAGEEPVVEAGLVIGNSETGGGAFTIVPRLVVRVCRNGLTVAADAVRSVHVGGRLEHGIRWSADTERKSLELVTARARDAVATFLDADYVAAQVARIEEASAERIADPSRAIERVGKVHGFTEAEQATILAAFVGSGDLTAGGVMQAVTAAAQATPDADRAAALEDVALDVLATAASLA